LVARVEQFLIWLGTQVDSLLRRRDVAFGLGAALLIVLLVGGVWLLRSQQNSPAAAAEQDEPASVTDAGEEDEAVPAGVDIGKENETAVPNPTAETATAADSWLRLRDLFAAGGTGLAS
jgi:hypothetical protein